MLLLITGSFLRIPFEAHAMSLLLVATGALLASRGAEGVDIRLKATGVSLGTCYCVLWRGARDEQKSYGWFATWIDSGATGADEDDDGSEWTI